MTEKQSRSWAPFNIMTQRPRKFLIGDLQWVEFISKSYEKESSGDLGNSFESGTWHPHPALTNTFSLSM